MRDAAGQTLWPKRRAFRPDKDRRAGLVQRAHRLMCRGAPGGKFAPSLFHGIGRQAGAFFGKGLREVTMRVAGGNCDLI